MNRVERRKTEKMLGLTKHYKTLSRSKKFEMQAERIAQGKQRQEETKEKVKQSITEQNDKKESAIIYTIAQTIANAKKIPLVDALKEAKIEFNAYHKTS